MTGTWPWWQRPLIWFSGWVSVLAIRGHVLDRGVVPDHPTKIEPARRTSSRLTLMSTFAALQIAGWAYLLTRALGRHDAVGLALYSALVVGAAANAAFWWRRRGTQQRPGRAGCTDGRSPAHDG